MNEIKKTEELGVGPAPWSVYKSKKQVEVICSNGKMSDLYVALCRGGKADANARLIAAAPKLYEALRQIMTCFGESVFDKGGMTCDPPPDCRHAGCKPTTCPVFRRAKAALAEASGGNSDGSGA